MSIKIFYDTKPNTQIYIYMLFNFHVVCRSNVTKITPIY